MEGGGFAIRTCASGNAPGITKGPRAKSQSTSNCLWKVTPLHSPVCCLLSHRSGVWYAGASLLHLLGQEGSSVEGNGAPLQSSCLENPRDGGAWWAAVHGVAKSRTRLSDFTLTFHFHALEKEMATHSRVLAWRIPGTGEPGGLPSTGSDRVGKD